MNPNEESPADRVRRIKRESYIRARIRRAGGEAPIRRASILSFPDRAPCPGGAVVIPLTRGVVAWVDAEDAERIGAYSWCADPQRVQGRWTAQRGVNLGDGRTQKIYMHREILNAPEDLLVDHRRHRTDGVVDNRRCNLRVCTSSQNAMNASGKGHPVKGASRRPDGRWIARIMAEGTERYLGDFASEAEALLAHDFAAIKMHGAFARTNYGAEFGLEQLIAHGLARSASPGGREML